jgi:tryptophanyl-tRNA synthetase
MQDKPRIFSGMQPTGELHIGNYLGALREWVRIARTGEFDALFAVVDAHATTVEYDAREMPERTFETALAYLAAGLDPNQVTLMVQADVPQHMELAWYLSTVTPMGDLHRMTQFKEKSEEHKSNTNAGLFCYPVLMAADIMLYKAAVVPVGDDQVQHLELTREICRKFNARFGDVFPEPKPRLSNTPRIRGLDGKAKMSKSRGNTISLFAEPKEIEKKLKGAFTDEQKLRRGDPGRPEVCNIFTIHNAVTSAERVAEIESECRSGALGCGDCKKACVESLAGELGPIRERALELRQARGRVREILQAGAARARTIAESTMQEVRAAMGMTTAVWRKT